MVDRTRRGYVNYGDAGELPPVDVKCPMDAFENHIRQIGIVAACEWFGHYSRSDFTRETIRTLYDRNYPGAKAERDSCPEPHYYPETNEEVV